MMRREIHRAVPETVTVDDIVGVELTNVGDCYSFPFEVDDDSINRHVDLKTGAYVSRRPFGGETSKVLNADEIGAIRRIIADSGILDAEIVEDAEIDWRHGICDGRIDGYDEITLITGTDRYFFISSRYMGFSFWGVWEGIMGVVALDDPPKKIRGW